VAQGYWPGKNLIGKHIANSRDAIQREVVGVVSDVKFNALNIGNSEEMYLLVGASSAGGDQTDCALAGESPGARIGSSRQDCRD
jgi:hypothetical protein